MKRNAIFVLMILCLAMQLARAEQLDPARWHITDLATGQDVKTVTDNRLDTKWSPVLDEKGAVRTENNGLLIDLRRPTVIHRIFFTRGEGSTADYTSISITFMQTPEGGPQDITRHYRTPTGEWWQVREERKKVQANGTDDLLPVNTPNADLKFNPLAARYLRLAVSGPIAELEVYGSTNKAAFSNQDAVVIDPNAADPLRIAAEDLRYYIGELTGHPIPIIDPSQEDNYPGILYEIVDLKPLAKTYAEMTANQQAGELPSGVNVERDGRKVLFRAWPYCNVAFSAWEFLRRQGVIWAALPDHAEYVPTGKGVNLDMLPLRYQPSFSRVEGSPFGCGESFKSPFNHGGQGFYLDDFLFVARNVSSVGELPWLSANEVPPNPQEQTRDQNAKDITADYREGFEGHPHNLQSVVPDRLLQLHPAWCGANTAGVRLPPSKGGPTFCTTNPELIQFVADKMIYWSGDNPECSAEFRLVPTDSSTFCNCPVCTEMNQPYRRNALAYVAGPRSRSEAYFYFISEVAKRVKAKRPNVKILALAYADYYLPPQKIAKLPDNVIVQVCLYGARNLPLTSTYNAGVRQYVEEWETKTTHLRYWDYLLIHSEWRTLSMPIPMVTAIVDREKYLASQGITGGVTQAEQYPAHNPWNYYAHQRMLWNVHLTAEQILDEFFTAYYQEAKKPMLAYYKALEDYLIAHNVSLEDFGYDAGPNPEMFTPQLVATLNAHLDDAQKMAKSWYVKQRVQTAKDDLAWAIPAAMQRSMERATALQYGKNEYRCPRRQGAIALDGKLDDAGWQRLPVAAGFTNPRTHKAEDATQPTEFRMTWDNDKLYVAVKCVNPNTAKLQPTPDVWGTDNFEFFLAPGRTYDTGYFQTAVSAVGGVWGPKHFLGNPWAVDEKSQTTCDTVVTRGDGYWICEMAIPFKTLGMDTPKVGDSWRVNLARNGTSWSRLPLPMWHLYHDFNFLTFVGEGGQQAPGAAPAME